MSFLNTIEPFTKFQSTTIITTFSKNPHRTTTLSSDLQLIQVHANKEAQWNRRNHSVKLPILTLEQELIPNIGNYNPISKISLAKLGIKISSFFISYVVAMKGKSHPLPKLEFIFKTLVKSRFVPKLPPWLLRVTSPESFQSPGYLSWV